MGFLLHVYCWWKESMTIILYQNMHKRSALWKIRVAARV
jgi:hypothetical protein